MSPPLTGLRAWLLQRITAVYLALFLVYFTGHLLLAPPAGYAQWRVWIGSTGMFLSVCLFFAALLLHAWVGIRDVVLDYVKPAGLRLVVLSLVGICLAAQGFWALRVLLEAAS